FGAPALGLFREASGPLPARHPRRHGNAGLPRPQQGAFHVASLCLRVDEEPRPPGASGRHLPGALAALAKGAQGMSARDEILASIRRSLGVKGSETIRRQIAADRLERAPRGEIPARGQVSGEERLALFRKQAEASLATVT